MIKFRFGQADFECSTAQEAADLLGRLKAAEERRDRSPLEALVGAFIGSDLQPPESKWSERLFWIFIESLGDAQKQVLSLLVLKGRLTDDQLRSALNLEDNRQLAGVLSGISKQAGAHNLPARAVYKIEKESKSGQVTKSYLVAMDFLRIATQMNWPGCTDDGDDQAGLLRS